MNRIVRVFDSVDALNRAAAEIVSASAVESVRARGRFAAALAGGSTPRRLYTLLAGDPDGRFRDAIPWSSVDVFWGDERTVPPDHADSNYRMAHEALLSRVPVPPARIHRIRGEAPDAQIAAAEYEVEMKAVLGSSDAFPRLDLVMLGMGADGHTASLFPGTTALDESERWVAAAWVEKLATHRVTLTLPVINHAARVLFLVAGADKAPALARVLDPASSGDRLPAARVTPVNGELLWFVDREAAAATRAGHTGVRPPA